MVCKLGEGWDDTGTADGLDYSHKNYKSPEEWKRLQEEDE